MALTARPAVLWCRPCGWYLGLGRDHGDVPVSFQGEVAGVDVPFGLTACAMT